MDSSLDLDEELKLLSEISQKAARYGLNTPEYVTAIYNRITMESLFRRYGDAHGINIVDALVDGGV